MAFAFRGQREQQIIRQLRRLLAAKRLRRVRDNRMRDETGEASGLAAEAWARRCPECAMPGAHAVTGAVLHAVRIEISLDGGFE